MNAAHDTAIVVDGDTYWVRRDFDLIKRLEQAFGPLVEIEQRLRRFAFTVDDLVRMLALVLRAQASRPPDDVVRDHVVVDGVREVCDQMAILVMQLFAGHKRASAWLAAEAKAQAGSDDAGGTAGKDDAQNPLQAALSTGISTLRRQRTWDGGPESSGHPPSMISRP